MSRMAPQDVPCRARGTRRPPSPAGGRRRDPHGRLVRALMVLAGETATLLSASSTPWASATFQGGRHIIVIGFTDTVALDALAARVGEAEFHIPGHIVADVSIDRHESLAATHSDGPQATLHLSALVIEDW